MSYTRSKHLHRLKQVHLREAGIAFGSRFLYVNRIPNTEDLICGPTLVTGIPNAGKSTLVKTLKSEGFTRCFDLDSFSSHDHSGKFVTHWRGLEITEDTVCAGISQTLLRSPKLKIFKNFVYISRTEDLILESDRKRKTQNFKGTDSMESFQKIRHSATVVFKDLICALQKLERGEKHEFVHSV